MDSGRTDRIQLAAEGSLSPGRTHAICLQSACSWQPLILLSQTPNLHRNVCKGVHRNRNYSDDPAIGPPRAHAEQEGVTYCNISHCHRSVHARQDSFYIQIHCSNTRCFHHMSPCFSVWKISPHLSANWAHKSNPNRHSPISIVRIPVRDGCQWCTLQGFIRAAWYAHLKLSCAGSRRGSGPAAKITPVATLGEGAHGLSALRG